jgi:glycosyltransferase involved in cell wall biosynthesis
VTTDGGLALFMSHGMSLARWDELGVLRRELAVYEAIAQRVGGVWVVSYGGPEERGYADERTPLRVLANERRLPTRAYAFAAPLLHRGGLASAGVFKTNQVPGGLVGLRAARLRRRPLVARCGYLWSEFEEADHGAGSVRARLAANYERRLFRGADAVVVTTPRLRSAVRERYGLGGTQIAVIPNFVAVDAFDRPRNPVPGTLLCVGRFREQKNLESLIRAVASLDAVSLTLVGDGPLRDELRAVASAVGADVTFAGTVPHERLPEMMSRSEAFVLPSHYEGHPKALIEAMAAGMPVVGADVQGIRELIVDGENGLLCGTAPEAIRAALERALGDEELRARLGQAARRAAERFSASRVADVELEVLESVVSR